MAKSDKYILKSLDELKDEYTLIEIYLKDPRASVSVSTGYNGVFWVAGDGYKTVFYSCMGNVEVLPNKDFEFIKVHYAHTTVFANGRMLYQKVPEGAWLEIGATLPHGLRDTDVSVLTALQSLTIQQHVQGRKDAIVQKAIEDLEDGKVEWFGEEGDDW